MRINKDYFELKFNPQTLKHYRIYIWEGVHICKHVKGQYVHNTDQSVPMPCITKAQMIWEYIKVLEIETQKAHNIFLWKQIIYSISTLLFPFLSQPFCNTLEIAKKAAFILPGFRSHHSFNSFSTLCCM